MSWYLVEINEPALLGGSYHRLCRQFQQAFIAASAPGEMAMFVQTTDGDVRRVYLSPGCALYVADLIDTYGGEACTAPDISSVILVYGTPEAFNELSTSAHGDGAATVQDAVVSISDGSIRVNGKANGRTQEKKEARASHLRAVASNDDAAVQ